MLSFQNPFGLVLKLAFLIGMAGDFCWFSSAQGALEISTDQSKLGQPLQVAPQVPQAATFVFDAEISVKTDRIWLGQVAECQGSILLCNEAYNIDLGPAPLPGRSTRAALDRLETLATLDVSSSNKTSDHQNTSNHQIKFKGPSSIKFIGAAISLTDDALKDYIDQQLATADFGEYEIECEAVTLGLAPKVRPGLGIISSSELTRLIERGANHFKKSDNLTFEHSTEDSTLVTQVRARVRFIKRRNLPVLTKSLPKDTTLHAKHFNIESVPVPSNGRSYEPKLSALLGKNLRRAQEAGTVLGIKDLYTPAAVRRGKVVSLNWQKGGLMVQTKVKILGQAGLGDQVAAQILETKKRLLVRVVSSNEVEIIQ